MKEINTSSLKIKETHTETQYGGMTVNERLYFSGLIDKFDTAVAKKDVKEITAILKEVELSDDNINAILQHFKLIKRQNILLK